MKGLIFDLDGVIALTEEIHRKAFDFAFAGYNTGDYNWNKDFAGKGHKYIIEIVFGKNPSNDRLIDRWVYYYQLMACEAKPVPGVIEYINSRSVPMIIATGSARKSALVVLDNLKIILPLLSMEDAPNPKPDPGLFLLAAKRIDIKPEDCTVFEDSIYGIQAGKTAGMKVIALTTTHQRELLEIEKPDLIINDFTDLMSKVQYPQFDER